MYPELFEIPFVHLTVKTYGAMMVIGFLVAVALIRHLSRDITPDPQLITNASLYALIAGIAGSRAFYVAHYPEQFRDNWLLVFAIWNGGLELLGGVIAAITVIVLYARYHKLPVRRYLDILAVGLLLALAFGKVGCFMRGCCFGRPTDLPWAVRFPYGSDAYYSQVFSDPKRNRGKPYLNLPDEFFTEFERDGAWYIKLKPYKDLTDEQKQMVDNGPYRSLPVHPTQLYSTANAGFLCLILYLFWKRAQRAEKSKNTKKLLTRPGCIFAMMFILYGITRFYLETLRDDNPFEYGWWTIYKGGTISQNLGIYLVFLGVVLMIIFHKIKPYPVPPKNIK